MTFPSVSSVDEIEDFDFSSSNDNEGATHRNLAVVENPEPCAPTFYGFDYSGVSAAIAEEAEVMAERIRNRHRASIIDTGGDLLTVKGKLGHGKFGSWLTFHFGMSERTAQNYMNAAQVFGSVPKVIDVLPPSTIYKLSAKGAPEDVRQFVVDEVATGAVPNAWDVESRITAAKREERRKREEQRSAQREELEWQKHEQTMRKAGKSDDEIEAERKRWDTKNAQRKRRQEKKLSEAIKREGEALRAREERQHREEMMKEIAARAARTLKARLGEEFEQVRDELLRIDLFVFQKALRQV